MPQTYHHPKPPQRSCCCPQTYMLSKGAIRFKKVYTTTTTRKHHHNDERDKTAEALCYYLGKNLELMEENQRLREQLAISNCNNAWLRRQCLAVEEQKEALEDIHENLRQEHKEVNDLLLATVDELSMTRNLLKASNDQVETLKEDITSLRIQRADTSVLNAQVSFLSEKIEKASMDASSLVRDIRFLDEMGNKDITRDVNVTLGARRCVLPCGEVMLKQITPYADIFLDAYGNTVGLGQPAYPCPRLDDMHKRISDLYTKSLQLFHTIASKD